MMNDTQAHPPSSTTEKTLLCATTLEVSFLVQNPHTLIFLTTQIGPM